VSGTFARPTGQRIAATTLVARASDVFARKVEAVGKMSMMPELYPDCRKRCKKVKEKYDQEEKV